MNRNPIIVALDFETAAEASALVALLGDRIQVYKIGLELYAGAGMAFARELRSQGKDVFLDMKFYDIPETVRRAVCQVARAGLQFLTVHGSHAVMRAAVEGRGPSNLQLLAVTVLTSFDRQDIEDLGYPCEATDLVDLRVRKAMAAGMQGIVASPLDATRVRRLAGAGALLVTPAKLRAPPIPPAKWTGSPKRSPRPDYGLPGWEATGLSSEVVWCFGPRPSAIKDRESILPLATRFWSA